MGESGYRIVPKLPGTEDWGLEARLKGLTREGAALTLQMISQTSLSVSKAGIQCSRSPSTLDTRPSGSGSGPGIGMDRLLGWAHGDESQHRLSGSEGALGKPPAWPHGLLGAPS